MKTALIAGVTGLIGSHLLDKLLASDLYRKVIALSRRQMAVRHPEFSVVITDFHELPEVLADAEPDDVFCCLGTTMARGRGLRCSWGLARKSGQGKMVQSQLI